ncbi:MICOS complex subunit MIC19-like, partial [Cynocephalus volans]|uniref:MICOS complex subunit MIC19-like n=1 Tax=Cynocephalus volans TaxID=110931 RepID=UPI002FC6435C
IARRDKERSGKHARGPAAANEQLTRAILQERISDEEEHSMAKHLPEQLDEKDLVIKKQNAFYKEQLPRLEERSSVLQSYH